MVAITQPDFVRGQRVDTSSSVATLGFALAWLCIVVGVLAWYIRAAARRSRRRVELMNNPFDAWTAYNPYVPPAPSWPTWSATAEGSWCPCGHGHRVLRHGDYGPFLGCSTWVDPDHGCQRACLPDGRPLPPSMWRRNRRSWIRSA